MFVKCTLIWIWQCNQGPNWTVKLNSAVEHHLTILCQGWGEKRFGGGRVGERKEKKKKEKSCRSIYLSPWPSVLVIGRLWLDHTGLGPGVGVGECVSAPEEWGPQNGWWKMESLSLHFLQSYKGWEAAGGSSLSVMLQCTFSGYNKAEAARRREKSQTGCCSLHINQMGATTESQGSIIWAGKGHLKLSLLHSEGNLWGPASALGKDNDCL